MLDGVSWAKLSRATAVARLVGLASHHLRGERLEEAARLLERASEILPDDVRLLLARGRHAAMRGDMAEAIRELERARMVDPFDEDVSDLLGRLLAESGEHRGAAECFADAEIISAGMDSDTSAEYRGLVGESLGSLGEGGTEDELLAGRAARFQQLAEQVDEQAAELARELARRELPPVGPLAGLLPEQRRSVASVARLVALREGETVFREGQPSEDLFVVRSGKIAVQRETPFGPQTLATVGAGELFGEINFIDGLTRSADAAAAEETELIRIPHDALRDLFARDVVLAVSFAREFWRGLTEKVREGNSFMNKFFEDLGNPEDVPAPEAESPSSEGGTQASVGEAEKAETLRQKGLSRTVLKALSRYVAAEAYEPEKPIFREGDLGDALYVVQDGRVRISKHISGVGEEALAILERGDLFGEMAIVDAAERSATALAHEAQAIVLRIDGQVIETLLESDLEAAQEFLLVLCRILSARLREINDKIVQWRMMSGGF